CAGLWYSSGFDYW
nr:immunoglobulin heavy chain junction region [Macaca mulatta]